MTPVFQKWLSFATAVSVGIFCSIQHAAAVEGGMAVKVADSDVWRLERRLFHRQGDEALFSPVLTTGQHECLSTASPVEIEGKPVLCKSPEKVAWYWYLVEPIANDYDNSSSCWPVKRGCVQPIAYRRKELVPLRGRGNVSAVDLEKLLGLGTHWIMTSDSALPADSSVTRTEGQPAAFEFVVRRDDSYTGYLTELFGVPFTYFPSLTTAGIHQTDLHLGADCVALVVYGQRRLGRKIPYMAPPALKRFTTLVAPIANKGQPVKKGDILAFGFQTAVISKDRNRIGYLADGDTVIHSYHGRAEETTFSSLPYKYSAFQVRRWKGDQ